MDIVDAIITFINSFLDYINNGIYEFATKVFAQFIKYSLLAQLQFKLFIIPFAWDVAKELLQTFNISPMISAAWSSLDYRTVQIATSLRIPEALNFIISAFGTKFVLKYTGL